MTCNGLLLMLKSQFHVSLTDTRDYFKEFLRILNYNQFFRAATQEAYSIVSSVLQDTLQMGNKELETFRQEHQVWVRLGENRQNNDKLRNDSE